ncbi:MAG: serine acetyltransferase [Eubacterium sp.]|nr:serine acetyltransferase [Eubacterium sp.]
MSENTYEKENNRTVEERIEALAELILSDYDKGREIDRMDFFGQPDQDAVNEIIRKLLMILYPGYYRDVFYRERTARNRMAVLIEEVMYSLRKQFEIVLTNDPAYREADKEARKAAAQEKALEFFSRIPKIREYLDTDIDATFDGDPAACDKIEIVLAYPGLYATTIHRMAHELYLMGIPYIPRMMSEHAHSVTGVDIHPGATIGKYFFIDHATGIVIGETSEIGEHVKVYQGVTVGALSTKDGQALHGVKRHPTIEDNVTLYSGASVLGGRTVIGHDSVIGGSAFVTESIAPYTHVLVKTESTVVTGGPK